MPGKKKLKGGKKKKTKTVTLYKVVEGKNGVPSGDKYSKIHPLNRAARLELFLHRHPDIAAKLEDATTKFKFTVEMIRHFLINGRIKKLMELHDKHVPAGDPPAALEWRIYSLETAQKLLREEKEDDKTEDPTYWMIQFIDAKEILASQPITNDEFRNIQKDEELIAMLDKVDRSKCQLPVSLCVMDSHPIGFLDEYVASGELQKGDGWVLHDRLQWLAGHCVGLPTA